MSAQTQSDLGAFVSHELSLRAEELTSEWLSELAGTLGEASPAADLGSSIPDVLRGVAEFTSLPVDRRRSSVIDLLRTYAGRRREQRADVQAVLTEFETLSRGVFRALPGIVGRYPGRLDPVEVATLAGQLREALMEITSEAVGLYRQEEIAQKKSLAKKLADFAHTIAHELKNPLGAAQAGTLMLQDGIGIKTAEDRDRFTRLILKSLTQMHALIDDIRSLALANEAEGVERWIPLDRVVPKVLADLMETAAEKDVHLLEDGTPALDVDGSRVEIALLNLVGNAIKYADAKKQRRWVRIAVDLAEDRRMPCCLIKVQDNGIGIPHDRHDDVFVRRFRAHPEVAEGTGYGLAITHDMITGGGGRISFQSEEGAGTTFFVRIPVRGSSGGD